MQKNKAARKVYIDEANDSPPEELRVTDRRRINIDGESVQSGSDIATEGSSKLLPTYVEQLKASKEAAEQKLVEVQSRFEQLRSQLQRDADETRQRLNRAADERARNEKAEFIAALLPVMDNLHRAIESSSTGSHEALIEGVRGTASGFENVLIATGVELVESVGAQFDPELHEAVDTIAVEPKQDGIVTSEYSRGYKMGNRLLRPARVQVGRNVG